jgi:predicted nucleic acid-binding protein
MKSPIVVDASVSASWFLRDECSGKASEILNQVLLGRLRLVQPILWKYETANILKTAIIKKRITAEEARLSISLAGKFPVEYHNPSAEDMSNILNLADDSSITAYDAAYVCTALMFSAELISADKDLLMLRNKFSFVRKLEDYAIQV